MKTKEHNSMERLQELARFLKSRRTRLSPEQAGLPSAGRRRTPGLRRAEVAQLSGISVDWYTWLEQARPIQVSAQVLESIARSLQLNQDERRHLFLLGIEQLSSGQPEEEKTVIRPSLQLFLEQQGSSPAFITDERLNIVAWNKMAALVYGDYGAMSARDRNSVWRSFTSPYIQELLQETWETHARHRLAQLRANYGKFAGDPWWMALIEELNEVSGHFQEWWPQHDIVTGPEGMKTNYHPSAGRLVFEQLSFQVSDAPHLTVTINMPADEDTLSRTRKLLLEREEGAISPL
ncbi:helix-turn-helix transcriptional regulator [Paenibacillus kobensis]|uniref:helix-turn-helix transcriptional regulator n=1 Tax=Paenibacillus kobensis TaxID=59841 RepID=UPI001FE54264|nr:helix-turn-helix transcriptional regulator [Paenibacillus kobensis]